jgi:arylsulfatase A-like enzyme
MHRSEQKMMKVNKILLVLIMLISGYTHSEEKPNVVLMVMDNLGWGEIGCYGGGILRGAPTPRLDKLASEGIRLLNFNVEAQCTPSRSALMTGRHPIRSGTTKVVWGLPYGMVGWEVTMAELFKSVGYSTAIYGKWHLGEQKGRWPTDQGFDEWYGIPNTTDEAMYTTQPYFDPSVVAPPQIVTSVKGASPKNIKEYNLKTRRTIDREITEYTIDFMTRKVEEKQPFFVYVPFTQTHLPPLAHPDFIGKTGKGEWADVMTEFDYNTGQILDTIDKLKIRENTIVIWMSENGPEEAPSFTGTAGPWRGNYFTTLEGSLRTPFIIRWPGKIPSKTISNQMIHITDLLPTFADVVGYKTPKDRVIDGKNQISFFLGKTKKSAREGFPAYNGENLQSYKWRNFKVHFWRQNSMFGAPVKLNFPQIHDLLKDPKELRGLYGGSGGYGTGTEQLTWVLPAVTKEILKFKASLKKESPVPFPAPEPYNP